MNINPSTRKRGLSRPRILVALLVIMLLIGIMGSVRPVQAQDDQPPPPDAGAIFETGQPFREQRHLQILREIEQEPQVALLPARSGLATFGGGAPAAFTDCSAVTDVPQSECEALVDVYITTNGPAWHEQTGWLESGAVCSWYGITCEDGHVVALSLPENNLVGNMPVSVANLPALEHLNLGWNPSLTSGPVPEAYSTLTNLTWLHLADTNRNGPMPAWIGNLTGLAYLNLSINPEFSAGPVPAEYANLTNLAHLVLYSTNRTGSMPAWIGNLTALQTLDLGWNPSFSEGPIPPGYANLTNLETLWLSDTNRTGPMPGWIGGLSQLKQLSLSGNRGFAAGQIPAEFANLANIEALYLDGTNRTGAMPGWIGNLAKLEDLGLSANTGLSAGPIPDQFGNLASIKYISLDGTNRTGPIPAWIGSLHTLEGLYVYSNHLSGTIPAEIGALHQLRGFNVAWNALEGEIPSTITGLTLLGEDGPVDLGYNKLVASDPAVVAFLQPRDPDWAQTQTLPPTNVQTHRGTSSSVVLTWTPIAYTAHGGYYEISYATSPSGPWMVHGRTADKGVSTYTAGGLQTGMTYYFRIRTLSPIIGTVQPNDLWSEYSEVVAGTVQLPLFADVPVGGKEWMQPWIENFYLAGITTGCLPSPLSYCPEREVTRAEMAVFILRSLNYPDLPYTPAAGSGTFADMPVASKEWMEPWVEEFYDLGITTGCLPSPLSYCPERQVTRAEMAVFVLRALNGGDYQPPAASGTFADVPVASKEWMEPWIEQFYREGITTGCGTDAGGRLLYCPERPVTRAEMAVFVLRAFDHLPKP